MQKIYLLLRNNKQTGPHSLEEMQQLTLLPSDLVWVEGKSVGWSSPAEIPALAQEEMNIPSPPVKTIAVDAVKKPQPKNRKIFVSLPGNNKGSLSAPITKNEIQEITAPDPAAALEKKAEALYQKIQAYQQQQSAEPKEELETKYARSLDDIKNEYSGWIHQQKNKKSFKGKQVLIAASVLILLIAGFFIYRGSVSQHEVLAEESTPMKTSPLQSSLPASTPEPVKKQETPLQATLPQKSPAIKYSKTVSAKSKIKPAQSIKQPVITAKKETPKTNNTYLPELVGINGNYKPVGRGVSASEVTLKNQSNEHLKVVAVDVVYYKADGSVLNKETIYFRNISPQSSLTLKAPANEKAEEVKYKLGLISASESGLFYAMN
ncbi:MAG: hypothetical protein ACXWB9_04570 [Flavisolibacter sp.]